jgi:hypothetical protein
MARSPQQDAGKTIDQRAMRLYAAKEHRVALPVIFMGVRNGFGLGGHVRENPEWPPWPPNKPDTMRGRRRRRENEMHGAERISRVKKYASDEA